MARIKKPDRKKEKLSKEEALYRSAASLMEAVDCIKRFERVVYSLNDAAGKFEKIDGYKDAAERKEKCIKNAKEAIEKGTKEVYNTALYKLENARDKSGFSDAIEEFKRVKKFGYNIEECNKNIQICKNGIKKAETRAMYKRQGITLCVILLLALIFVNTPFYPLIKGMYYQSEGQYSTALGYYKKSGGILNGHGNIKECHYYIAEKFMKKGNYNKALKNYKKAHNKFDAEEKAFNIERDIISKADKGSIVNYGRDKWIILTKTERQALLFSNRCKIKKQFDTKGKNIWHGSSLCKWLNKDYIKKFNKYERSIMAGQGMINEKDREIISILDKAQYEKYKDMINSTGSCYWLKDSGSKDGMACCVKEDALAGEASSNNDGIYVRSSLWVVFK